MKSKLTIQVNRVAIIATIVLTISQVVYSQDETKTWIADTLTLATSIPELPFHELPFTITDNYIGNDSINSRLWHKISKCINENNSNDSIRIMHIGDSHVKGGIFPKTTGELLKLALGKVKYQSYGINGASFLSFANRADLSRIYRYNPDCLIISFGTNESHGKNYISQLHYQQINKLVSLLKKRLPQTTILLTTPPGSYLKGYSKYNNKLKYSVNTNANEAAKTIVRYANDHNLLVWDLYSIVGGASTACQNWLKAGMMYSDYIHYLPQGYTLQGQLLYEAILKAYNNYNHE